MTELDKDDNIFIIWLLGYLKIVLQLQRYITSNKMSA
jgi:hypothetical protein